MRLFRPACASVLQSTNYTAKGGSAFWLPLACLIKAELGRLELIHGKQSPPARFPAHCIPHPPLNFQRCRFSVATLPVSGWPHCAVPVLRRLQLGLCCMRGCDRPVYHRQAAHSFVVLLFLSSSLTAKQSKTIRVAKSLYWRIGNLSNSERKVSEDILDRLNHHR